MCRKCRMCGQIRIGIKQSARIGSCIAKDRRILARIGKTEGQTAALPHSITTR